MKNKAPTGRLEMRTAGQKIGEARTRRRILGLLHQQTRGKMPGAHAWSLGEHSPNEGYPQPQLKTMLLGLLQSEKGSSMRRDFQSEQSMCTYGGTCLSSAREPASESATTVPETRQCGLQTSVMPASWQSGLKSSKDCHRKGPFYQPESGI